MDQTKLRDHDEIVLVREQLAHLPALHPADLVDFVVGSELATEGLHRPVANTPAASPTIDVADLGELVPRVASKPGLLAHFSQRTLER